MRFERISAIFLFFFKTKQTFHLKSNKIRINCMTMYLSFMCLSLAARIKLKSENINNSRSNLNWPKWQWLMSMYFRRFIQTTRNLRIIKFIVVLNVFQHFFPFYQVNAFTFGCIELETIFIVWHFWQLLIVLNKEKNRSFNVK